MQKACQPNGRQAPPLLKRNKHRNKIKPNKKQIKPKITVKQLNTAIRQSRDLYDINVSFPLWTLEDKSYVKYDFSTPSGP